MYALVSKVFPSRRVLSHTASPIVHRAWVLLASFLFGRSRFSLSHDDALLSVRAGLTLVFFHVAISFHTRPSFTFGFLTGVSLARSFPTLSTSLSLSLAFDLSRRVHAYFLPFFALQL